MREGGRARRTLLVDPEEEDVHGADLCDCVVLAQPQHLGRKGGREGGREENVGGSTGHKTTQTVHRQMKRIRERGRREERREGGRASLPAHIPACSPASADGWWGRNCHQAIEGGREGERERGRK